MPTPPQRLHSFLARAAGWAGLSLALALAACGGGNGGDDGGSVPVQKGFGPSQLYDPASNPTGRVLQEGDTGIVSLSGAGQQVWFEVAKADTYGFEMADEDLAVLSGVEVASAGAGRPGAAVRRCRPSRCQRRSGARPLRAAPARPWVNACKRPREHAAGAAQIAPGSIAASA